MLFFVYRSIVTMLIMLFTVMIELTAARGVVAVLANYGVIGLSTYSTNLLTLLVDRRRHGLCDLHRRPLSRSTTRRRRSGSRFYTMFRGTAHVISARG